VAQAEKLVARLQARIVKAARAGRWHKVKALQYLLTRSRSARLLAVKRVTENKGKQTPGVDQVLWTTPAEKRAAVDQLRPRGYRPLPLRRVYVPKKNGQLRPLGIPTMKDRAMQALYLQALDPVAEVTADRHSYGFRRRRSCADAIEQCFTVLANRHGAEWVLEGDIEACFDRLDHDWLLAHAPMERDVLRKWLKAGYLEKHVLQPTEAGTPQGGVASPVLANLAQGGLEAVLREFSQQYRRKHRCEPKVNLVRYADDFIITGRSRELLEEEVYPLVAAFLRERGLTLSPSKTRITAVRTGFDFLGQHVRKYGDKLLIKPSRANVAAFLRKLGKTVKSAGHLPAAALIHHLNLQVRGWAGYHRHVVSKATFNRVDTQLFRLLYRWACRRHPKKSRHWITERYYTQVGGNRWVFFAWEHTRQHSRRVLLYRASQMRIVRHRKVRSTANPYDPADAAYFAQRHAPSRGKAVPTGDRDHD
jgi:RNA-directed DNA polymerase